MAEKSFYLPGGGLPRGGLAAAMGLRGGPDVLDLDGAGNANAPDAVEANEMLIHRLAAYMATPTSNAVREGLNEAVAIAEQVLANGPGDDSGEEVRTLQATLARVRAARGTALPTTVPVAAQAQVQVPWGLLLLLGGGGLLLWWLGRGER